METDRELETQALEITSQKLLKRFSYRRLSEHYHRSASVLHRAVNRWLSEDRFMLVDRMDVAVVGAPEVDEYLGERLGSETNIWRARVVRVSGTDGAYGQHHLANPKSPEARVAYAAADVLHVALGRVAADLFLSSLRRNMTVGLASGRGVGFTITHFEELAKNRPTWVAGLDSIHIVSLCGGARVGPWATAVARDLDADENAFALQSILGVPRNRVTYQGRWISERPRRRGNRPNKLAIPHLDLALVGLGQLNTQHHFLRHAGELQLEAIAQPLQRVRQYQSRHSDLLHRVAEIGHRLFPVGGRAGLPRPFLQAIDETNEAVVGIHPNEIKEAGETILVAGGAQKLAALLGLLLGDCPDAPVDLQRLTLVTDAWTAERILSRGRQA